MVIQFLGHRDDGCLDWFDVTEPVCTTPTPAPCPDGLQCCGIGEYDDFCFQNDDGDWIRFRDGGPCACDDRFTEVGSVVDPGTNVKTIRCYVCDCGAVDSSCCGSNPPENCLGEQWPGNRFIDLPSFNYVNITCTDCTPPN